MYLYSDVAYTRVMIETVIHKWLRVPHILHVGDDIHPRQTKVTVVFVHGLANSHHMWKPLLKRVSDAHTRVITVDLLGFGNSPKPEWQTYSATVHAQSLKMTLRSLHINGPLIIVGHSLGSLVAVQYAGLYPRHVHSLILCSPPFYRPPKERSGRAIIPQPEDVYRRLYSYSRSKADLAKKMAAVIKKAKLLDANFTISDDTLPAIISSLEMSIENQTSLQDAEKLTLPIHVIYGKLDPFIINRNIRQLESKLPNATLETVVAGHEIGLSKQFTAAVIDSVHRAVDDTVN